MCASAAVGFVGSSALPADEMAVVLEIKQSPPPENKTSCGEDWNYCRGAFLNFLQTITNNNNS